MKIATKTTRELQPPHENKQLTDHLHHINKKNTNLFPFNHHRINLNTNFPNNHHTKQTDTTHDQRFTITFTLFDVGTTKTTTTINTFPTEQTANDEGLT
jgi:hypothetical protein